MRPFYIMLLVYLTTVAVVAKKVNVRLQPQLS